MNKALSILPRELKEKYSTIWKELFEGESEEAKLVKQIDILETIFQALEYEKEGYDKERLDAFWRFHKDDFKDPNLKKLFELLEKER